MPDAIDELFRRFGKAFNKADNSPPSKGAKRAVSELRDLVSEERVLLLFYLFDWSST